MLRDLYSDLFPVVGNKIDARTKAAGAVDGEVIDLGIFEGAGIFCAAGTLGAQVNTYEFELKEAGAAEGPFTAVADEDLLGSEPSFVQNGVDVNESDTVKSFGYAGSKRYIRVDLKAPAGAGTGGGVVGALVIKGHARHKPAVS